MLDLYREEALTLEQLMAFAVNPDQERQMQVFAQLPSHNRQTYAIRRAMTEAKVPADDRRAVFVGLDAYVAAGGPVLADLFTEAGEGWLEDVALLDRLVEEKLSAMAVELRQAEELEVDGRLSRLPARPWLFADLGKAARPQPGRSGPDRRLARRTGGPDRALRHARRPAAGSRGLDTPRSTRRWRASATTTATTRLRKASGRGLRRPGS